MTREFDKRNMAKSRRVCEDMEAAHVTKWLKLTERERQILAMWPRFEDGEPVMIGDEVDGLGGEIIEVYIAENAAAIWNNFGHHMHLSLGERVKRPAPEVLDADGVLIKAGDTVWHEDGSELHVIGFGDAQDGETMLVVKYAAGPTKWGEVRCLSVTHTRPAPKVLDADGVEIKVGDTVWYRSLCTMGSMRKSTVIGFDENNLDVKLATLKDEASKTWYIDPKKITHVQLDSWERLEEDAADLDDMPCDFNAKDLIRRAKALAGAEAGR